MGCYKIGSECCNNCIHWDCHTERKFRGNPPAEVYTDSNCDKCDLTGRNTLSKDTCGMFKHLGGVTKTFAAAQKHASNDYVSSMFDSCDETTRSFCQSIIEFGRESSAIQHASRIAATEEEDTDEFDEADEAFVRWGREMEQINNATSDMINDGYDFSKYGFDEKRRRQFYRLWKNAKSGDAKAQFQLAKAFWNGECGAMKENASSGRGNGWHWCNESADNDYCWAQLHKGISWWNDAAESRKIEDYEKAIKWLEKALQHIDVRAKDREKNYAYSRALNNSRIALGVKYLNGKDVVPDFDVAMSYFGAVADAGDSRGDEYKRKAEELREKLRNAVDAWLCLSANDDGDVDDSTVGYAFNELGKVCAGYSSYVSYQLVMKKDIQKAVECFEKAADLGQRDGMDNLGNCYLNGCGVEKDAEKAVAWYRKSAESGWPSGQYHYAKCLRKGDGVEKDETAALKWFIKAGAGGHARSLKMLGWCAEGGRGMDEDPELAFEWYKLAAEAGDAESMYELGRLYKKGYGCGEDETLGDEWQEKAAQNGYSGGW